MRLSQLRELARRLGVGRYSSMLRDQLMAAILIRAPRDGVSQGASSPSLSLVHSEPPLTSPEVVSSVESGTSQPTPIPDAVSSVEGDSSWVALIPRDPQWARVCWSISSTDRLQAQASGGVQLALRITDVTDSQARDGRPHTLQEVFVEAHANEWHLPLPLGDRDYRVELGYRTASGGWTSIGFSPVTRMPALEDVFNPPVVPFTFSHGFSEDGVSEPAPLPGVHERMYQNASSVHRSGRLGSEAFHEQGALAHGQLAAGGQASAVGRWASGREASGAGMAPRQRSFWLVADAELIVYGATDPSATLTVGSQRMPLSSDGTFSVHTAFPDGGQTYPIRALAVDGEQQRSITLDFRRTTPHAKVNSRETAVPEWF